MKLIKVINTKAIRLFPVVATEGAVVSPAALARTIENRYGFMQGPRTLQEYDLGAGVVFQGGMFGGKSAISKFTVYRDGMVCETLEESSFAYLFIDDLVAWACSEHSLVKPTPESTVRAYMSIVDVQMEVDIGAAFPGFDGLCRRIVSTIRSYGQSSPDFQPTLFGFHGDLTTLPSKAGPPGFTFERREGEPYEARRYFARAPLRTSDHIDLLGVLENLLTSMTNA